MPRSRPRVVRRAPVLLGAVLLGAVLLAGAVARFGNGASGAGATAARTASQGRASESGCPVGRWSIPAQEEFVQVGLGTMTDGSVQATGGSIRVVFAPDRTYTFTYDDVRLTLGRGAGTAAVDGSVHGTWQLVGDRLTTSVRSSSILVQVSVAGVTLTPSRSLNEALQRGMPSSAEVECSAGQLLTTVSTGAAAGRRVAFARG